VRDIVRQCLCVRYIAKFKERHCVISPYEQSLHGGQASFAGNHADGPGDAFPLPTTVTFDASNAVSCEYGLLRPYIYVREKLTHSRHTMLGMFNVTSMCIAQRQEGLDGALL
jgi:hypothetical protein